MTLTPWFELLSEKKLLAHLATDSPDPSAAELIVKLLAYAPRPAAVGADVELVVDGDGEPSSSVWNSLQQSARAARRVAGLQYKLLAVQVFAYLQWRFPALDKQVPLPLQQSLLTALLTVSGADAGCQPSELASLSPQAVFAVSLYHRWVLWTVCQQAMPRRPPRNVTIQLPGQQDPTVMMPHVVDAVRQSLEAQVAGSEALLTRLVSLLPATLLPTADCFGRYTETAEPTHVWRRAAAVSSDELVCQVNFELGRFHFFKARYSDAARCFAVSQSVYSGAAWRHCSDFVWLSEAELTGYCLAVNGHCTPPPQRSLYHRLRNSIANGYQGVIEVLLEDNKCCELPLTTRDTLARDVEALRARRDQTVPSDLAQKIDIVNCVRRALEGRHQVVELSSHLANDHRLQAFLLCAVLEVASAAQSGEARQRLRMLVLRTGQQAAGLVAALAQHPAGAALYTADELTELCRLHDESDDSLSTDELPTATTGIRDPVIETGSLERRLMESYSPMEIRRTLHQLAELQPGRPLWRCNTRWELPIPVQSVIMSLPAGFGRDYFYIVMAKAKELLALKRFDASRDLLQTILEDAQAGAAQLGQTGAKLTRLIGWERLLADLLQLLHNWPKLGDYRELTARAKSCLSALQTVSDVLPRSQLLEHCTLYLLNVCEWDHLSELERRWPQVDLAALLATVCREIVNKSNNRKMSRDLWNAVIPMFTMSGQQKRSVMGSCSAVQRDSPHAIMPRTQLTQFIQKVHEHTSLSVLTSLLTRLHNILLDDSTREISLEHAGLWPNVVNSRRRADVIAALLPGGVSGELRVLQPARAAHSAERGRAAAHDQVLLHSALLHTGGSAVPVSRRGRLRQRVPIRGGAKLRRRHGRLLRLHLGHESAGVLDTSAPQAVGARQAPADDPAHRTAGAQLQQQRGDPAGSGDCQEGSLPTGHGQTVRSVTCPPPDSTVTTDVLGSGMLGECWQPPVKGK